MIVRGSVNYLYIYDVGSEIDITQVERVAKLTKPVGFEYTKLMPNYITVSPSPLLITADSEVAEVQGIRQGTVEVAVAAKAYEVGAISVTVSIPLDGESLENLTKYSSPTLVLSGRTFQVKDLALSTVKKVLSDIGPYVNNLRMTTEPEEYTTFCVDCAPLDGTADEMLAKILTGDTSDTQMSQSQIASTLKSRTSYYADDAVFIDWSAALVVDPSGDYGAILLVIELANLQLLEMRYYDSLLDELVGKASLDLTRRSSRRTLFGSSGTVARKVAEQRIEIDSVVEATKNYTKFIGEWYIARVYSSIAEKLRLKDWDASLSGKLGILEDIYSLVSEQMSHRREILLEIIIVALFVAEIIQQFVQWELLH